MTNVANGVVDFDSLQFVDISDTAAAPYIVKDGDILFNRTNSPHLVGRTGLVRNPPPCVFASYLVRLQADRSRVMPEYLNTYLNWDPVQQRIREMATRGVSQANVSASKLAELEVRIPSLDEQERIARIIQAAQSRRLAEEVWSDGLACCFEVVLNKVFRNAA
jgi:type I restriction enzyme S subunit